MSAGTQALNDYVKNWRTMAQNPEKVAKTLKNKFSTFIECYSSLEASQ